jgi:uncharacterized membrane protein
MNATAPGDIIAIGYQDEAAAVRAAELGAGRTSKRHSSNAVSVIVRDDTGSFRVVTENLPQVGGRMSMAVADLLFDLIFVAREPAAADADGPTPGSNPDDDTDLWFVEQLREVLRQGSKALLLVVEDAKSDDELFEVYGSDDAFVPQPRRPRIIRRRPL